MTMSIDVEAPSFLQDPYASKSRGRCRAWHAWVLAVVALVLIVLNSVLLVRKLSNTETFDLISLLAVSPVQRFCRCSSRCCLEYQVQVACHDVDVNSIAVYQLDFQTLQMRRLARFVVPRLYSQCTHCFPSQTLLGTVSSCVWLQRHESDWCCNCLQRAFNRLRGDHEGLAERQDAFYVQYLGQLDCG